MKLETTGDQPGEYETICISVQVQVSSAETSRHDEIVMVTKEDSASPMMSEQYSAEEQTIPKLV